MRSALSLSYPKVSGSWPIWTWVPITCVGWGATDLCTAIYEGVSTVLLRLCLHRTFFASPDPQGVPICNLCQDWRVGKRGHGRSFARVHELSTPFQRLASGGRNYDGTSTSALCRRTRWMDHLRGTHPVHVCRKGPIREPVMHTLTAFPIHA